MAGVVGRQTEMQSSSWTADGEVEAEVRHLLKQVGAM